MIEVCISPPGCFIPNQRCPPSKLTKDPANISTLGRTEGPEISEPHNGIPPVFHYLKAALPSKPNEPNSLASAELQTGRPHTSQAISKIVNNFSKQKCLQPLSRMPDLLQLPGRFELVFVQMLLCI